MTPLTLNRSDRRRLRHLGILNTSTVEADRRFFDRRSHRTYRIRRASRAEIDQLQLIDGGKPMDLPRDSAVFALVKQFAPGVRLRIFVPGPGAEDGNDVGDDLCARLWQRFVEARPEFAEREAAFHRALFAPGGPLHDGGGR